MTAAGTLGTASAADAALFYWQDRDPTYYRPIYRPVQPPPQPRKHRSHRHSAPKTKEVKDTGAKPQGPLIINVSIGQQKVRIYDANGLFAQSPVSTGKKGHPTPMGVFSVIQKHKYHHSNIYSGAPMPYMQRITWSGVAMHAGVVPGYPASHGCIRVPMAFAIKMWRWTRMGARVIVTPGEITPARISHPLLAEQKVVPQPVIADDPKTDRPSAVKGDKGADAGPAITPSNTEAGLDLRPTVGHASPPQTQTADASGSIPADSGGTMSDAPPSTGSAQPAGPAVDQQALKSEAEKSDVDAKSANGAEPVASDSKAAEAPTGDARPTDAAKAAQAPVPSAADAADAEVSAVAPMKAEDKPTEAKTETSQANVANTEPAKTESSEAEPSKTEPSKADLSRAAEPAKAEATPADDGSKAAETSAVATKPAQKSAEPVKTETNAPGAKKDTARLPGAENAVTARAELPKPKGRIAVFVSRKDSKLYVRDNFKPLFDVPVTIAPGDRPLGTHVFTAEADKNDPNLLRWSVVSLPVRVHHAARHHERRHAGRHRKAARAAPAEVETLPVADSPAEALDRITIPPEAMARITEALTTGASIVVSDQGIRQGETGEGTDFIVSLH